MRVCEQINPFSGTISIGLRKKQQENPGSNAPLMNRSQESTPLVTKHWKISSALDADCQNLSVTSFVRPAGRGYLPSFANQVTCQFSPSSSRRLTFLISVDLDTPISFAIASCETPAFSYLRIAARFSITLGLIRLLPSGRPNLCPSAFFAASFAFVLLKVTTIRDC